MTRRVIECTGNVFFTADTHFGHSNIIKYCNRPFLTDADRKALADNGGTWHTDSWKGRGSSNWRITRDAVQMMDDELLANINAMVGEDDILWHLGDFAMPGKSAGFNRYQEYRRRINCKNIFFVWGNHDPDEIECLFTKTFEFAHARIHGVAFELIHYAMCVWDKSHREAICLYGHSHAEAEEWQEKHMPGRRSMDVGVDNAFRLKGKYEPFTYDEVMQRLWGRTGFTFDHHIPKNTKPED